MRRWNHLHLIIMGILLAVGVGAGVLTSCSDDPPAVVKNDGSKKDMAFDTTKPTTPDSRKPDSFPQKDKARDKNPWPNPEAYVGSSFGCQSDTDCFGQRCCPTPWGVKLCASTCQP
jgi:hypothetical protein